MIKFIKEVFSLFFKSNTFQKGGSLAYYAVFSFIPIIVIIISFLGVVFGEQAVSGEVYAKLKDILGEDASIEIQNIIKNQYTNHNSIATTIIGFAVLAFSASIMLVQLHNSFNSIWSIKVKPKSSILRYLSRHLVSLILLISLFFIILISTTISSFLIKHSGSLHNDYRFSFVYEHLFSFAVMSIVFAIMFKFLGDAKVHWKSALYGGLITSILFLFGKVVIGYYIGLSNISSTFGSASAVALLLIWVFYISQIIFLGASFVKVISSRLAYEILPNSYAEKVENVEVND